MDKKTPLSLSEVKKQFGAWQVPSQAHFEALINIAALSLKPGSGLSGGDPSPQAGSIDTGGVKPLRVNAHKGMEATKEGLTVKTDPACGLEAAVNEGLKVRASGSVGSDDKGVFLKVNASAALRVDKGGIAVKINDNAGFKQAASTGVSLSVDNNTVEIDKNGALWLKCDPIGGLTADQDGHGHLGVDLDIVLRRPCIRAHQGWACAYIPKNMIEDDDRVFLYIHDMYVGEIDHTGPAYYVTAKNSEKATEYWIAQIKQWVTEKDVLRARLIRKGQNEATGIDIASHTVTLAGSAPATIPRISQVNIVNASDQLLTTVKAGDSIHVKSSTDAQELTYCWLKMNSQTKAWNFIEKQNHSEFMVPANAASGEQFCVLLERKDTEVPFAFSPPVTVM